MLFMVIEHFRPGAAADIAQRFTLHGRMLPDNVTYFASWLDTAGTRCFQLMEAPAREALDPWTSLWDDLILFEIFPVLSSAEFWASRAG
jgi:hypothetical protein